MKISNSTGPKKDPSGALLSTELYLDFEAFPTTLWTQPLSQFFIPQILPIHQIHIKSHNTLRKSHIFNTNFHVVRGEIESKYEKRNTIGERGKGKQD